MIQSLTGDVASFASQGSWHRRFQACLYLPLLQPR